MNICVDISLGEFFDKMTILEIKKERIMDENKLENIRKEYMYLQGLLVDQAFNISDIESEISELKQINEKLWVIEDDIREKERNKVFDGEFIELARSVYITNDRRSDVKREINSKLGSEFVEEKSYEEYQ